MPSGLPGSEAGKSNVVNSQPSQHASAAAAPALGQSPDNCHLPRQPHLPTLAPFGLPCPFSTNENSLLIKSVQQEFTED